MKRKSPEKNRTEAFPRWAGVLLTLILLLVSGIFMAKSIDLTTADLGRHLMNGRIFLEHFTPVKTNYYSYTEPALPVVNHHWGTGVIYDLVYRMSGFEGLSLLNILVFMAAVAVFFRVAVRKSDLSTAFFMAMLMMPLIASRAEVRPEIISFLFAGITFSVLERFRDGSVSFRKVLVLPVLMLFWVNLHIFFVMGLVIQGAYLAESLIRRNREKIRQYGMLMAASAAVCLLNPSGVKGFIEPFLILREYGYRIAENQTLFFMQAMFPWIRLYIHFEVMAVFAAGVIAARMISGRKIMLPDAPAAGLLLLFTGLSFAMIRVMPLFGFFFIPVMAGSVKELLQRAARPGIRVVFSRILLILGLGIALAALFTRNNYFSAINAQTGLGWDKKADGSAAFFKNNNLKGPVFNNYDIGGYLIFHLFPAERVFVDNRPEAYPVKFFKEVYEPMQVTEEKWKVVDSKYRFNVIFFNRLDNTTYAQPFLIRRISDPEWAPVFVDDRTIILLRKNELNEPVIREFGLPASMFVSEPSK